MRRWTLVILAILGVLALAFSPGCAKKTLKETPDDGESQPEPGPRPPGPHAN